MKSQQGLDKKIKAVAPIDGVSIGEPSDKSTWRIDFKPGATQAEKDLAQAVIDAFDVVAEDTKVDAKMSLDLTDKDIIRVIEDIIADDPSMKARLSQSVQDKLTKRKNLRAQL